MDFCFMQNMKETHILGIFAFSHNFFRTTGIYFSHVFQIVLIFASCEIFKKFVLIKFVFSHSEFTFSMLWELYGILFHAKHVRNPWLSNVLFFQTFLVLSEFSSSCFWDNTTDVKTNKNMFFRSHFHSTIYLKLFTKEVNLVCCSA